MARPEAIKTKVARRRSIANELEISKRLAEEARTASAVNPSAFAEYLCVDIYIEQMLSDDPKTRYDAAKAMLGFSLARKRAVPAVDPNASKTFSPSLPSKKTPEALPESVTKKIISIRQSNA